MISRRKVRIVLDLGDNGTLIWEAPADVRRQGESVGAARNRVGRMGYEVLGYAFSFIRRVSKGDFPAETFGQFKNIVGELYQKVATEAWQQKR